MLNFPIYIFLKKWHYLRTNRSGVATGSECREGTDYIRHERNFLSNGNVHFHYSGQLHKGTVFKTHEAVGHVLIRVNSFIYKLYLNKPDCKK